ncbi:Rrf2 family transcriptional regulator [Candidatus Roizmanbacteria bacterium]|nr:Rrf2 family transcriptional regulator [Candidatus Roizmanbacteria bacterium]
MLSITSQSDYGIMLISYLRGKKDFIPLSQLLNQLDLPKRFLARIAALLVKAGILESREGKVGGYRLTKKAKNLNLYDYLKVFEGELAFVKCQDPDYDCPRQGYCMHKDFFKHSLTNVLSKELKKHKLLQIYK